jgi:hypothetical protein
MSLVDALFDWFDACLSMYFPQECVRAPVTDCGTSRALCHDSSWKSEEWMCRYTCKMVGGVCAGQWAQVRLSSVKENCHIKRPYNSNWLCCPVTTTTTNHDDDYDGGGGGGIYKSASQHTATICCLSKPLLLTATQVLITSGVTTSTWFLV